MSEGKIPKTKPDEDIEIFLIILEDNNVVDIRLVGDGLLGNVIKRTVKWEDSAVEGVSSHPLSPNPGYQSYKLKQSYTENFDKLKLAMNLLDVGEKSSIRDILGQLSAQNSSVVLYGSF